MFNLPRTVIILGLVSFLTDFSSEMIYPLLPVFLSSVLGAGAMALGVVEGVAEATASLLKVVSGIWADKIKRRKPFILSGYGLAGAVRPLIGLAGSWPFVLVMRFMDRVGKGLRTSPRDALIAESAAAHQHGWAFGFHRAMDHAGAVVGPLVAAALLGIGLNLRQVFYLAGIPAAVVMAVIIFGVREQRPAEAPDASSEDIEPPNVRAGREYRHFLAALLLFTLGNSTDAFLLLRLTDSGVTASHVALLWSALHVVKMVASALGGRLSDRYGPGRMLILGWIYYAVIYVGFGVMQSSAWLVAAFVAYGLYFGLVEPAERTLVAALAPRHKRGAAFGWFHMVAGLGALPASLLFGLLWKTFGATTAFLVGASLAIAASIVFLTSSKTEEPASKN
jgi:MFS family permease